MTRLSVLLLAGATALAMMSTAVGQAPPASGDAAFAAGDFAAAERILEARLKTSPTDVTAMAGMARIRLFQNRNDEAIALGQKVLAGQPDNPVARQTVATAQQRKAMFGSERYQIAGVPPEVAIPFAVTDPLPIVQVTVGGRQAWFLIDTGGPDIIVAPELAKELGLTLQDAGQGVFAGGVRAAVQRTVVPEIQIGGIKIANVPAGVRAAGLPVRDYKIEGIVGTGLLMHFLPTLDYCQGRLVLRPRSASASFERAAAGANANVVPMWLVGDHFVFARGHLKNGAEGPFLIDTGLAGGGLTANKASLDEAGVTIDPARAGTGIGGGGAVTVIPFSTGATLGTLTVNDVRGIYSPGGDPTAMFPFRVKGLLSHGFFRHSRLTFDFDAMNLITEQCAS